MGVTLWIDFETRSRVDLGAKGVYNYAMDLSTEVLCMSYAFDDGPVQTWAPKHTSDGVMWLDSSPFPEAVANHTGPIYAHNAAFERLIFGTCWGRTSNWSSSTAPQHKPAPTARRVAWKTWAVSRRPT